MTSRWTLLVAAVAVVLAAAGCTPSGSPSGSSSGSSTGPSSGSSSGPSTPGRSDAGHAAAGRGDAAPVWAEFVRCARAQGHADWPDAVVDDQGRATFPEVNGFNAKQQLELVRAACGQHLAALPPRANPYADQPLTAQGLDVLRRYARCMRENGVPDFPDPDADGNFHLSPGFWTPQRQRGDTVARPACDPIREG